MAHVALGIYFPPEICDKVRDESACFPFQDAEPEDQICRQVSDKGTLAALMRVNKMFSQIAERLLYGSLRVELSTCRGCWDDPWPRPVLSSTELVELGRGSKGALVRHVAFSASSSIKTIKGFGKQIQKAGRGRYVSDATTLAARAMIYERHKWLEYIDLQTLWPKSLSLTGLKNLESALIRSFPISGTVETAVVSWADNVMIDLCIWSLYFRTCPRPVTGLGIVQHYPLRGSRDDVHLGPSIFWLASFEHTGRTPVSPLDLFAQGTTPEGDRLWEDPTWGLRGLGISVSGGLDLVPWKAPKLSRNPWVWDEDNKFKHEDEMPYWVVFATPSRDWTDELRKFPRPSVVPCMAFYMRDAIVDAADLCYILSTAASNLLNLCLDGVKLGKGCWEEVFDCAVISCPFLTHFRFVNSTYLEGDDSALIGAGELVSYPSTWLDGVEAVHIRRADVDSLHRLLDCVKAKPKQKRKRLRELKNRTAIA